MRYTLTAKGANTGEAAVKQKFRWVMEDNYHKKVRLISCRYNPYSGNWELVYEIN